METQSWTVKQNMSRQGNKLKLHISARQTTKTIVAKHSMASWKGTGLSHPLCYSLTDEAHLQLRNQDTKTQNMKQTNWWQTPESDESVFVIILKENSVVVARFSAFTIKYSEVRTTVVKDTYIPICMKLYLVSLALFWERSSLPFHVPTRKAKTGS